MLTVRRRRVHDVSELARILADQQASSGYPVRWPLPFPVEEFLVRRTEEAAWVAELDGSLAGHVSVCRPGGEIAELLVAATGASGPEALAEVAVLFVDRAQAGQGVGGVLLETAVEWIRGHGRLPVLDVVPTHHRALELYRRRGWRVLGETRPDWLPTSHPAMVLMALGD